jgi:superfamily I DNA/RNA helicase
MGFVPSEYQKAIFEEFKNGKGNVEINACAGSGKTSTLLQMLDLAPKNAKCVFVAFGKAIADELKTKVPSNTHAATIHSVGMSIVRRSNGGKVIVDAGKIKKIMDKIPSLEITKGMMSQEKTGAYDARRVIEGMVEICKSTMADYTDAKAVADVCDKYNVEFNKELLPHFIRVMEKSIEDIHVIDYNDMVYLPVVCNMTFPKWEYVFVDECQDLNRAQIDFVLRMVTDKGRIFTVGDPNQSIFGFRGADSQAMPRLKEALKSKSLPLSICYRCPETHLQLARKIVPHIKSFDKHPGGTINHISRDQFIDTCKDGDLVLCRVNAHLATTALELISARKKVIIKGRDIGKNLVTIIRNLRAWTMDDLYENLDRWERKQTELLTKRDAPQSVIDLIEDKAITIRVIADECKSVQSVIEKIENLFSDDNGTGVILSTVHRAKGLEAKNVYIINPEMLPLLRKNQAAWELQQEKNIQYVAYTRSLETLTFVTSKKE